MDSLDSASAIFAISVNCLSVCSTKILHGNLASIMCSVCMIIDVNSQFLVYFFFHPNHTAELSKYSVMYLCCKLCGSVMNGKRRPIASKNVLLHPCLFNNVLGHHICLRM